MTTKTFKIYLILNYKTGAVRVGKREINLKKIMPSELPIVLNLNIKIPEAQSIKVNSEIEIGDAKVKDMVIEALGGWGKDGRDE